MIPFSICKDLGPWVWCLAVHLPAKTTKRKPNTLRQIGAVHIRPNGHMHLELIVLSTPHVIIDIICFIDLFISLDASSICCYSLGSSSARTKGLAIGLSIFFLLLVLVGTLVITSK